MKKVICFLRVSSSHQELKGQRDAVLSAIKKDDFKEDEIEIIEKKESAIKLKEEEREGLNEMKELIEDNPIIKDVYFFAIDRLARSVKVVISIVEYCNERGVKLHFLNPHSMSTLRINEKGKVVEDEFSKLLLLFLSYGAEMEMQIKKARFKEGKTAKRAEGKHVDGKVLFGYKRNPDKTVGKHLEESETVKQLYYDYIHKDVSLQVLWDEYAEKGLVKHLKSGSTRLSHLLSNPIYLGNRIYPRIIDKETQDKAIEKMHQRKTMPKTQSKMLYFGKGLIIDKATGLKMSASTFRGQYVPNKNTPTPLKGINFNFCDSILWHCAKQLQGIHLANYAVETKQSYQKEINSLEESIAKITVKIKNNINTQRLILKQLIDKKVDEKVYREEYDILKSEEDRYNKQIAKNETSITSFQKLIEAVDETTTISDKIENISSITEPTERKKIIDATIDKALVSVSDDGVKILEVVPKYIYKLGVQFPLIYKLYKTSNNIQIKELWERSSTGECVEINYTGEYLRRFKKDKQGNYQFQDI